MRISIITLTLDSPRYFDEAVGSIEREGNVELEHIVVHDGDETFIDGLRQRRPAIKILKGRKAGPTAAAALGVEAATGDFILLLHSDDRLCPGARSGGWRPPLPRGPTCRSGREEPGSSARCRTIAK
jgi:glycosyltransferase involved in cell wall biosynthesis